MLNWFRVLSLPGAPLHESRILMTGAQGMSRARCWQAKRKSAFMSSLSNLKGCGLGFIRRSMPLRFYRRLSIITAGALSAAALKPMMASYVSWLTTAAVGSLPCSIVWHRNTPSPPPMTTLKKPRAWSGTMPIGLASIKIKLPSPVTARGGIWRW
ncbi:hypothetical protein D3C81_1376970 [compost metagenome]